MNTTDDNYKMLLECADAQFYVLKDTVLMQIRVEVPKVLLPVLRKLNRDPSVALSRIMGSYLMDALHVDILKSATPIWTAIKKRRKNQKNLHMMKEASICPTEKTS